MCAVERDHVRVFARLIDDACASAADRAWLPLAMYCRVAQRCDAVRCGAYLLRVHGERLSYAQRAAMRALVAAAAASRDDPRHT